MKFRIKKVKGNYVAYYLDEETGRWHVVQVNHIYEFASLDEAMYESAKFKEKYEKENGTIVKEFEL